MIQIKFLRRIEAYTEEDRTRNESIRTVLDLEPLEEKVKRFEADWEEHLTRMDVNRLPRMLYRYKHEGCRS